MKNTNIQMVLTDVDGVLTNGGFGYNGKESINPNTFHCTDVHITFNTKDGAAFRRMMNAGIFCGVITNNNTEAVKMRLRDLKIPIIHTGVKDKLSVFKQICYEHKVHPDNVVYVGDDFNDVPILSYIKEAWILSDAHPFLVDYYYGSSVKRLFRQGGEGILQEIEYSYFLRDPKIRSEYLERNGIALSPISFNDPFDFPISNDT